MKESTIEELAYILEQAHEKNKPKPIFFLGAGASVSGEIPLADDIVKHILNNYSEAPRIKKLSETDKKSYAKVMEALQPDERNELLKGYIDKAKVNVTHLYLAQLICSDYVDYVLTVNFDNLMLRALSLFNEFPSTYDMAIFRDLTTTEFKEKSVFYLHGQHHGPWLLSTHEEMEKVDSTVPNIFNRIQGNRPWIFIGYSGNDPIFEHIKRLGRFDNGLFWVTHKDNSPNKEVKEFLDRPNTNAFLIKGEDSDSFILKLHTKLDLEAPQIIDKPFSCLKEMLNNIVDINSDSEEHFKNTKERLEISKEQVNTAIDQFEKGIAPTEKESPEEIFQKLEIDVLKREIITLIIKEKYDENTINKLSEKAENYKDSELNDLLAGLYSNWGSNLGKLAWKKTGKELESLYEEAFGKYGRAIEIKRDNDTAFNNWGNNLGELAGTKTGKAAESLYEEAFGKYGRAIEIKRDNDTAFNNWGIALGKLAGTKEGQDAEILYEEAFGKYERAIEIKPDKYEAFYNWGNNLGELAGTKTGKAAESLYEEAFGKYERAIEIKPDKYEAFYNWGNNLGKLAGTKEGQDAEILYEEAFEKYQQAIELKPDLYQACFNWGNSLSKLAKTKIGKESEILYEEAFGKYERAIEIKPDKYEAFFNWGNNLDELAGTKTGKESEILYEEAFGKYERAVEIKPDAHEVFTNWGHALGKLADTKTGKEAERLYEEAFGKYQRAIEIKPDYDTAFNNWGIALGKLAGTKTEKEAERLYEEAFEKYQQAIEIKPDKYEAFYNWGNALGQLAGKKTGKDAEKLYEEAFAKCRQAVELGGSCYNLSCLYAVTGDKENALHYLELSLRNKMTADFVEKDADWTKYLQDRDWKDLLNKYR
ncbi:tetratricopeptide repeat protein [Candidatus Haliotispira prima]|uniref:Tetratricopeptide repeat protein n=1 Tax=Candidatus Haliotispira prima TaxID=3034016 RepID=A0ABY8MHZ8_9SPIO|nr:tetratricopeptide repeat protein [Candidatus Haliotispira prima]